MIAQGFGCGGDDGDDDTSGTSEESLKSPDCIAISEACHDEDEGKGEVNACHMTAHADEGTACKSARQGCLALCAGGSK